MRGLRDWYWTLVSQGIWSGLEELESFTHRHRLLLGRQLVDRVRSSHYVFGERQRAPSDHELIAMAPCPLRPVWNPHLRRLSDKVLLAMTDSEYFWYNPHYAELAPILLAALLSVPDGQDAGAGVDPEFEFHDRLRDALEWLARELPAVELPEAADRLLNEYARGMLEPLEHR
jgi:hypothetical protein